MDFLLQNSEENRNINMTDIKSMTKDELKNLMTELGEKPFRAKQIYSWLHEHLVTSYDEMGNIPGKLKEKLEEKENIHIIDLGGCIKASEYFAKQDDPKIKKIKEKVIKNQNTTYVQYNFGSDWQPQIGNQCLWFLTTDYSDNQIYTPLNSWQGVYRLIDDKKGQYFQRYSAPSDTDIAAQVTLVNMEKKLSWE